MSDSAHLRLWLCILILLLSACGGSASSGGGNGPGGTNLVDVAIVYETKMQVYDDDRLRAASLKAIEEANRIFRNSGSKTRLRLVAVRPVSYTSNLIVIILLMLNGLNRVRKLMVFARRTVRI